MNEETKCDVCGKTYMPEYDESVCPYGCFSGCSDPSYHGYGEGCDQSC